MPEPTVAEQSDRAHLNGARLLDWHLADLRQSAITDDVIRARGYQTVPRDSNARTDSLALLRRVGIPGSVRGDPARYPGLLFPLFSPTGECRSHQYRPDKPGKGPNGKEVKYVSPSGRTSVLDVHPFNRDRIADPTVRLWITEGVKKGDALTSRGECVVSLAGVFNWRSRHGTLGDWEDVPLRGREVIVCFDADAATNPHVARAMDRLGRWLKSKGVKTVRYIVTPSNVDGQATKGVDDYLAAGGDIDGLLAVADTSAPDLSVRSDEFADARLAETFTDEVLHGRFCWVSGFGWMKWTGQRWTGCEVQAVIEAVRLHVLDWYGRETRAGADSTRVRSLYALLGRGRIVSIVALAQGIVTEDAVEFDAHTDLLNTPNGVVNLRTGQLAPHDPDLLLTKMTAAEYHADATHADITAAMEALPEDVRRWLLIRYGQALTGVKPLDDVVVVSHGAGANGKSTLNGCIKAALGDYAVEVSDRVLLADPHAHPTELMDFRGARFALLEETPEAGQLNTQRLKTVTADAITARLIRRNDVTFSVTHALFVDTNYRPVIPPRENNYATWRRVYLVEYPYTYRKPHEDIRGPNDRRAIPGLKDRMRYGDPQHRAMLAMLVKYTRWWYANGEFMPDPPQRVVEDTEAWRAESDVVLRYIRERLVFDVDAHVWTVDLLRDVNLWLVSRGHRAWSDQTVATRFGEHELFVQSNVAKVKMKATAATTAELSRPELAMGEIPASYRAWPGVRFQRPVDRYDIDLHR